VRRRIIILGSTGSIGKSCLDVIRANKNLFKVVGLSAQSNDGELGAQVAEFKPEKVALAHEPSWRRLRSAAPRGVGVLVGDSGPVELVETLRADVVVTAIAGGAGLSSVFAAVKKGIRVAIANKEPLVMAGGLIMSAAKKHGSTIAPIDSEHSALWQCLRKERPERVARLILTASGGPFLGWTKRRLSTVTPAQALNHPQWKMGRKISVDSSTMMNKGLEVIEARWLFDVPAKKIEVVVHPQSIVHSMVEFVDSSVIAQLGLPDMRVPIAYALSSPDRWPSRLRRLSIVDMGRLDFMPPDLKRFPCLSLAYEAVEAGGGAPIRLNAANEVAVEAFLGGRIGYADIPRVIAKTLARNVPLKNGGLKGIMEADAAARETARGCL
jgi:1-deoxy-D-xylulose-5-phosphate reductoisomerase